MIASISDVLPQARRDRRAVAGFNVFGLDEAYAVARAAEEERSPVILMTNREIVARIPVEILAPALRAVAASVTVPVCVHLDHTYDEAIAYRAIAAGYTSVMFDGSQLPYGENVGRTARVVEVAHAVGVAVEGEIGSVSYNDAASSIRHELTEPEQAAAFARDSGVDAVAVSVGSVHKLTSPDATIEHERLARIHALVSTPLVIHGTSGIPRDDLARMARDHVAKFNIGTVLRLAWGHGVRRALMSDPDLFDRVRTTDGALADLARAAADMMRFLAGGTAGTTTSHAGATRTESNDE